MMSASGGMIIGVQAPLDWCKFMRVGEFREGKFRRPMRALWIDRTARKGGRRSLRKMKLWAS
jgi:hypothetical protein